jgi:hypothetical protein
MHQDTSLVVAYVKESESVELCFVPRARRSACTSFRIGDATFDTISHPTPERQCALDLIGTLDHAQPVPEAVGIFPRSRSARCGQQSAINSINQQHHCAR